MESRDKGIHAPTPSLTPAHTHQLQGLTGAAAQPSPGNAQRVSKQHQLFGVAQLIGGTLGVGRKPSEGVSLSLNPHVQRFCPSLTCPARGFSPAAPPALSQ